MCMILKMELLVTMALDRMDAFAYVWMKGTVLGAVPATPTISGPSRLNALQTRLPRTP